MRETTTSFPHPIRSLETLEERQRWSKAPKGHSHDYSIGEVSSKIYDIHIVDQGTATYQYWTSIPTICTETQNLPLLSSQMYHFDDQAHDVLKGLD
jgi:hypothetical protein